VKLRLFAEKPCPVHNRLAFWVGSEIYCNTCLTEMGEQERKDLCEFWARLIIATCLASERKQDDSEKDTSS
jgi:hypothetical protein